MKEKWSDGAWESIEPIYQKIKEMPFITELIDGTLDREKFAFYIQQDAMYIKDFGKALARISANIGDKHKETFMSFAADSFYVEKELHDTYFKEYGISTDAEQTPTCRLYTSYLYSQFYDSPMPVIVAAVLPCFWIYKEIGDYIIDSKKIDNNPYQAWIDTYGSEEFAESVRKAIAICDELAEGATPAVRDEMTKAFVNCSRMEWMFWDSAYNLEQWPV
ncbi:MAG: thiaminase II [Tannerella sp.]|jgi:thiaminase/transcriptional activator TenA|nr:thiaminase II [Tannerella sp.]